MTACHSDRLSVTGSKFYQFKDRTGHLALLALPFPQARLGPPTLGLLLCTAEGPLPENGISWDNRNPLNSQAVALETSAFQSLKKKMF